MQKQPLLVNNILGYAVSLRSVMHPSDMFHMAWTGPMLAKAAPLHVCHACRPNFMQSSRYDGCHA